MNQAAWDEIRAKYTTETGEPLPGVPSNFHTHTTFCDGENTPEELAAEALRLGCPALGFSGHSYTSFDSTYCMSLEGTQEYCRRVRALKEQYAGRLQVYLGVEQDFYSDTPTHAYDYVIGSVHYLKKDGQYLTVDHSREWLLRDVERHYGGDVYAYIEDYYDTVAQLYERTGCQIVGHFDLVTKFIEQGELFDTSHPRYRAAVLRALDCLCRHDVVFEINTGAIARGLRTSPYPEPWIREEIRARGKRFIRNSDCHKKELLLRAVPGSTGYRRF